MATVPADVAEEVTLNSAMPKSKGPLVIATDPLN